MDYNIRRVDYFYFRIKDEPGEAYKLLSVLEDLGINMIAFAAIPVGPTNTQLTVFPEDSQKLVTEAKKANLNLDGPFPALFVYGEDKVGALMGVHKKLYDANINVYSTNGVTSGDGKYGYILHLKANQYKLAEEVLGI